MLLPGLGLGAGHPRRGEAFGDLERLRRPIAPGATECVMSGPTVSLGGDVIVLTLVGGLVIPIVLIVLAGELGRRAGNSAATALPGNEASTASAK